MIHVICYDIADDRRREAIALVLSARGARVQLSVFECDLDPGALVELKARLLGLIDPHDDQIRLYALPNGPGKPVDVLGNRRLEERADFWIV